MALSSAMGRGYEFPMRYWTMVAVGIALVAAILPLARVVHTVIGDAQIACALALVALLVRRAWEAREETDDRSAPDDRAESD